MIEKDAQILIESYLKAKLDYTQNNNKDTLKALKEQETLCVKKLGYLVRMRTSKYKKFSNFEDLQQEGFMALFRSMENYDQNKGSFFWWAHKYIGTKVSRQANLHTAVRYPLKYANKFTPHKDTLSPNLVDWDKNRPDVMIDNVDNSAMIKSTLECLSPSQKEIISMVYGIDHDRPYPINKICNMLNISRNSCWRIIKSSMLLMKNNILSNKNFLP